MTKWTKYEQVENKVISQRLHIFLNKVLDIKPDNIVIIPDRPYYKVKIANYEYTLRNIHKLTNLKIIGFEERKILTENVLELYIDYNQLKWFFTKVLDTVYKDSIIKYAKALNSIKFKIITYQQNASQYDEYDGDLIDVFTEIHYVIDNILSSD